MQHEALKLMIHIQMNELYISQTILPKAMRIDYSSDVGLDTADCTGLPNKISSKCKQ